MEYIEREAAINRIKEAIPYHDNSITGLERAIGYLQAIPAADVRPVVKATWKRIDYKPCGHDYECSSCGWENDMVTHFCPNCGADMRELPKEE